jgi:uncharacterized protein
MKPLLTFLLLTLLVSTAQAQIAVPPLTQRVTDLTGTLTVQQTQTLEAQLADFERSKGAQIAVLIVPTTAPETIEQYSIRVVDAWKLGRKGVDDGVLLRESVGSIHSYISELLHAEAEKIGLGIMYSGL